MLCPICGKENEETIAFCENCGNPLHRPAPFTQPEAVPEAPAVAPEPIGELPGKTAGIVGLVLGICSLLFSCCVFFLALPGGITGIILSAISLSKAKAVSRKNNLALAGLICSIIGTVFALLGTLVFVAIMMQEFYL